MKKTIIAVLAMAAAIVVAFSATTFAVEGTSQVNNKTNQKTADKVIKEHKQGLKNAGFVAATMPVDCLFTPAVVLSAPHHGIEVLDGYVEQIENPVTYGLSKAALAPFRLAAAVLSGPYYLVYAISPHVSYAMMSLPVYLSRLDSENELKN